jgi:hypothetical protein
MCLVGLFKGWPGWKNHEYSRFRPTWFIQVDYLETVWPLERRMRIRKEGLKYFFRVGFFFCLLCFVCFSALGIRF